MIHPWRKPCPNCLRLECAWHESGRQCDGQRIPFHLDQTHVSVPEPEPAPEPEPVARPAPLWARVLTATTVAALAALALLYSLLGG